MTLPALLVELLRKSMGITQDSRKVKEGYIFFAIKGTNLDGHDFVSEALERKALAVVIEEELNIKDPKVIKVKDTRKALAESSSIFFGKPSEHLKVIGITGTNGKTTTTHILERIISEAGFNAGLMGTIYYRLGEKILGSGRTTPDPITWHRTLRSMHNLGATHVVAEISSHALDQDRIWATKFDTVMFTNLSQDHLDYHGDMESYFLSKRKLFEEYDYDLAIVNSDDEYGQRLVKELGRKVLTYGKNGEVRIKSFSTGFEGSEIELEFKGTVYRFRSNLIGNFQAYNIACAVSYALVRDIDSKVIQEALDKVYVPGRFEVYRSSEGFLIVVDYAHTPDAMENVLRTIRKLTDRRVITVFGAGGNRDKTKRPLMGRAAERWSDLVILTSDNPRNEEPEEIIRDILSGIEETEKVIIEPDRKEAIRIAIQLAEKGDIVAVLGKGHEDYQEIKGVKYPFSDAEVIKEFLQGGEDVL